MLDNFPLLVLSNLSTAAIVLAVMSSNYPVYFNMAIACLTALLCQWVMQQVGQGKATVITHRMVMIGTAVGLGLFLVSGGLLFFYPMLAIYRIGSLMLMNTVQLSSFYNVLTILYYQANQSGLSDLQWKVFPIWLCMAGLNTTTMLMLMQFLDSKQYGMIPICYGLYGAPLILFGVIYLVRKIRNNSEAIDSRMTIV